jgi:hypothetical protein
MATRDSYGTLRGTSIKPAIAEKEVTANPEQKMATLFWRWGPQWTAHGRTGYWAIETIRNVAVRVVMDPAVEAVDASRFYQRLEDVRNGADMADDYLRSLDQREELLAIREAALAGRLGGAADGAPRKRTRKVAAR